MQINRVSDPLLQATGPQQVAQQVGNPANSAAAPTVSADLSAATGSGVTYTGSGNAATPAAPTSVPDLSTLSLGSQLELGKNLGVFTKVTISKEAELLAKADPTSGISSTSFVASAVTTMQDLENGFAVLKQNSASATSGSGASLVSKFRNLQQLAGKLNVFA